MPVNLKSSGFGIRGEIGLEMSAHASSYLVDVLKCLSDLAKPKTLFFSGAQLIRMEQVPGLEYYMTIHDTRPIDEIVVWQIWGRVGLKTVNVIAHSVFHTFETNRSGHYEKMVNGKSLYDLRLEDVWQDSGKWQEYRKQLAQADTPQD